MNILALDPAWAKPYAYYTNCMILEKYSGKLLPGSLEVAISCADVVVTEEPYYKLNVRTMRALSYAVGRVITWCEVHDKDYYLVQPRVWQQYHVLTGLKKEWKEQGMRALTGEEDLDIAAAKLIYEWAIAKEPWKNT